MPRVVYFFRGGRRELIGRIAAGTSAREFLYGYDEFVAAGWNTSYAEPRPGDKPWTRLLCKPMQAAVGAFLSNSFAISNAAVHWDDVQSADILVSTTDGNTLPLLALKKLGLLRGKIIGISQGLYANRLRLEKSPLGGRRLKALGKLLGQASCFVVLGEGDERGFRDHFGEFELPRIEVVPFGADEKFWTPGGPGESGPILSVGTDHLRDYETLLRAADDLPLRIVTRLKLPPALVGAKTTVDGNIDDPTLRNLYRSSRFVVLPIKNEPRDSGHSVTVQAMACGKAVILSDTAGLWDRALMRDGETCRLVPPGDVGALRSVMRELWNDPTQAERIGRNARRLVETHWTSAHFGRGLVRVAESLLQ